MRWYIACSRSRKADMAQHGMPPLLLTTQDNFVASADSMCRVSVAGSRAAS